MTEADYRKKIFGLNLDVLGNFFHFNPILVGGGKITHTPGKRKIWKISPGRRPGLIFSETKFSFTCFLKFLDHSHWYFRKYGPVVGGIRKLWFSFFTDFDVLLVLNVNYTIFFWKSSWKYKNRGVNHHQAIFSDFLYFFLWFSRFSVPADTIFGWWRHTDVTMTSHKIFFCQSHPLRLFYDCAIGFCSTSIRAVFLDCG